MADINISDSISITENIAIDRIGTMYPNAIDSFTRPKATDPLDSPSHADIHDKIYDAIEALETKVGVDDSAVVTSLDYLLKNTSSVDPGHKHSIYAQTANNLSDLASAATARTNLGVAIGSDVQAWDAQLDDIAALAVTDGNFIVGNGSNWVVESGATVRTSLGLVAGGTGDIWVEKAGDTMTGPLTIDGSTDAVQLTIQANSTQTANILEIQSSTGSVLFSIDDAGELFSKTTTTNPSSSHIVHSIETIFNGSSGSGERAAFHLISRNKTTGSSGTYRGIYQQSISTGPADITTLVGGHYRASQESGSADTLNIAIAGDFLIGTRVNNTINSGYGVRVSSPYGTGTITNLYGIFIEDQSAGTNSFAILTNAGNVVINEGGDASTDFRVEGDTDTNLLFTDAGDDRVGVGIGASLLGKLHIDQASATAAIPVLYLDQADVSEEILEITSTAGVGNAIELVGAKTLTVTEFIKVTINGNTRYIEVGTIA